MGLRWWGSGASGTGEMMKYNTGGPVGVIDQLISRVVRCKNTAQWFIILQGKDFTAVESYQSFYLSVITNVRRTVDVVVVIWQYKVI